MAKNNDDDDIVEGARRGVGEKWDHISRDWTACGDLDKSLLIFLVLNYAKINFFFKPAFFFQMLVSGFKDSHVFGLILHRRFKPQDKDIFMLRRTNFSAFFMS